MTKKAELKELNKPDFFHSLFNQLADYYILNKKKVIMAAGAVIGVAAMIIAWTAYNHYYEKNAWSQYAKIEESTARSTSPDSGEMIKKYRNLASQYPDSQASHLGYYRLGNLYYNKSDFDAAISSYEKFIAGASDRNEFKVLSYSGLAYSYESKKDYKKALESLQQAEKIEAGKSLGTFIYRDMGRLYEKLNNPGEALKCYKKALEHTLDPAFTMLIKRKIAMLT